MTRKHPGTWCLISIAVLFSCLPAVLAAAGEGPAGVRVPDLAELPGLINKLGGDSGLESEKARADIVILLNSWQGEAALRSVKSSLAKGDRQVKTGLIRCLVKCGRPEALEPVIERIGDSNKWVQLCALAGLRRANVKDRRFLSEARRLLGSDDPLLKKEAILALGHLKDSESVVRLVEVMNSGDEGLRQNAQYALESVTGMKLGPDPERWYEWLDAKEKLAERDERRGLEESRARREVVTEAARVEDNSKERQAAYKGFLVSALLLMALTACFMWLILPGWLRSKLGAVARACSSGNRVDIALVARKLQASDLMPDFVVYPLLMTILEHGSPGQKEVALQLLELRAYGGCRLAVSGGGLTVGAAPSRSAREWISRLPRSLLQDVAILQAPGRRLIDVVDSSSFNRAGAASSDQIHKAQRGYKVWLNSK